MNPAWYGLLSGVRFGMELVVMCWFAHVAPSSVDVESSKSRHPSVSHEPNCRV